MPALASLSALLALRHDQQLPRLRVSRVAVVIAVERLDTKAARVKGAGNAYLTGMTWSTTFPSTSDAAQPAFGGGWDAFTTKIIPSACTYSASTASTAST